MKCDDQKALDAQTAAARRKDGTGNLTGAFFIDGLYDSGKNLWLDKNGFRGL